MTTINIANYIIKKASDSGLEITQMQLQKLLFLIEVESFKRYDKPLLSDNFTSFEHGPIIKSLYPYVSEKGSLPLEPFCNDVSIEDKKENEIIDFIVNKYAKYSASYLRNYTHHFYSWKNHFQEIMPKSAIREDAIIINKAMYDVENAYNKVKDLILD